jgi:Mn-dependent DtxR family transcriptional regulator
MTARGLTTTELAAALLTVHVSPSAMAAMLEEDAARGIVKRTTDGTWTLTPQAEHAHGRALRGLHR